MFNGNNAEREHFRRSQCSMVIMPSVSILGEANGQCSMAIMRCSVATATASSLYPVRDILLFIVVNSCFLNKLPAKS